MPKVRLGVRRAESPPLVEREPIPWDSEASRHGISERNPGLTRWLSIDTLYRFRLHIRLYDSYIALLNQKEINGETDIFSQ